MIQVSASLFVWFTRVERQAGMIARPYGWVTDVQGSTSRTVLRNFQLESLILAQNERWRQA